MSLTSHDITHLAKLARLEISPEESAHMLVQLNTIFGLVEKMRAVDTQDTTPLTHPIGVIAELNQRLRDDVITESDMRIPNQRSAPAVEDGLFLVPKVID